MELFFINNLISRVNLSRVNVSKISKPKLELNLKLTPFRFRKTQNKDSKKDIAYIEAQIYRLIEILGEQVKFIIIVKM